MKKVIVAGANGFVGRNLLRYLLEKDIEIYGIIRKHRPLKELGESYNKIHWIVGDLCKDSIEISHQIIGSVTAYTIWHGMV